MIKSLPRILQFGDYHEILAYNDELRDTGLNIKCKELCLNYDYYDVAPYVGIVYAGDLKRDKINRNYLSQWKQKHLIRR